MSSLSPRLQVRVQQKQILTPGLVQMVSLLQLNRLELKEMISAEVAQNPVLEESLDGAEELSADELRPLLEAERVSDPADQAILENSQVAAGDADIVESDRGDFEAANLGNPEPASLSARIPLLAAHAPLSERALFRSIRPAYPPSAQSSVRTWRHRSESCGKR